MSRADLVRQTRTSSEWVFPDAKSATPVRTASKVATPSAVKSIAGVSVAAALAAPVNLPVPDEAPVDVRAPVPVAPPAPRLQARPASNVVAAASEPVRRAPHTQIASASVPPSVRPAAAPASTAAAPSRVKVYNAVGRNGMAARYSRYLTSRGWSGLRPANAQRMRNTTLILYPAGGRAQAAELARRLPFRTAIAPSHSTGSHMMVFLGSNALTFDNRLRRVARA
jgi:hypothetical protein